MKPVYRIVMHRLLTGEGVESIAKAIGVEPRSLQQTINSEIFQVEYRRLLQEQEDATKNLAKVDPAYKKLLDHQLKAADRLGKEVDNEIDGTPASRIKASTEILDRTGLASSMKNTSTSPVNITIVLGPNQKSFVAKQAEKYTEAQVVQ